MFKTTNNRMVSSSDTSAEMSKNRSHRWPDKKINHCKDIVDDVIKKIYFIYFRTWKLFWIFLIWLEAWKLAYHHHHHHRQFIIVIDIYMLNTNYTNCYYCQLGEAIFSLICIHQSRFCFLITIPSDWSIW